MPPILEILCDAGYTIQWNNEDLYCLLCTATQTQHLSRVVRTYTAQAVQAAHVFLAAQPWLAGLLPLHEVLDFFPNNTSMLIWAASQPTTTQSTDGLLDTLRALHACGIVANLDRLNPSEWFVLDANHAACFGTVCIMQIPSGDDAALFTSYAALDIARFTGDHADTTSTADTDSCVEYMSQSE